MKRNIVQCSGIPLLAFSATVALSVGNAHAQTVTPAKEAPLPAVSTDLVPLPDELANVVASGVTADKVGAAAAATSYEAQAALATLESTSARVDQALVAFLPRLSAKAAYSRLSDFTPPAFGTGALVATPAPAGTLNPSPTIAANFSFPLVLNNYLLQAQLAIPVSDYFLRIAKVYSAATHAEDAARFDVIAARAKSSTDGKIAYYNWLRARGALYISFQAQNDVRTHLKDARNALAVGHASMADVLRAETASANAELLVERSRSLHEVTEKQVVIAMHLPTDDRLIVGERVDVPPPPYVGNLKLLVNEAHSQRPELKSIELNAKASRANATLLKAGRYPSLIALGEATYANPNPRRIPASNDWFPTWAVGAQVTWSPNDVGSANAQGNEWDARAATLDAQKQLVRDGIELEVHHAYNIVREADLAIGTTRRQLVSATEAHRVARELFTHGRATSTTLTDAETDLLRARLEALNASIEARMARVRLEHAAGRVAKAMVVTPR